LPTVNNGTEEGWANRIRKQKGNEISGDWSAFGLSILTLVEIKRCWRNWCGISCCAEDM
jgi:hypothetical protein